MSKKLETLHQLLECSLLLNNYLLGQKQVKDGLTKDNELVQKINKMDNFVDVTIDYLNNSIIELTKEEKL